MFTGLIETKGTVAHLQKHPGGARITVRVVPQIAGQLELGDSIAVNGCCVTVVEHDESGFTADLVPETLAKTNLGLLAIGSEVNLERAMMLGDRFGGHWVQGHVDCLGQIRTRKRVGNEDLLEITVPFEVTRFVVPQGSVTVDGVSLTVVDVAKDRLRVALIPHTRELTTLGGLQPMDVVNIELDVLAKYLDKHLSAYIARLPRMLVEAGATIPPSERPVARASVPEPAPEPAIGRRTSSKIKEPRSRAVTSTTGRAERPAPPKAEPDPAPAAAKEAPKSKKKKTTATAKKPAAARTATKAVKPAAKKAAASKSVAKKTAAARTTAKPRASTGASPRRTTATVSSRTSRSTKGRR